MIGKRNHVDHESKWDWFELTKKATGTQISTFYNYAEHKSISDLTTHQTRGQMDCNYKTKLKDQER